MNVTSTCPRCKCQWGWVMNQVEPTPDGGVRPRRAPDCPRCGYDVTGTNGRAHGTFYFFAKTDDVDGMRQLARRADLNTLPPGHTLHPLVVAATYGSARAAEFLLTHGADQSHIPLALATADKYRHPAVVRLLEDYIRSPIRTPPPLPPDQDEAGDPGPAAPAGGRTPAGGTARVPAEKPPQGQLAFAAGVTLLVLGGLWQALLLMGVVVALVRRDVIWPGLLCSATTSLPMLAIGWALVATSRRRRPRRDDSEE